MGWVRVRPDPRLQPRVDTAEGCGFPQMGVPLVFYMATHRYTSEGVLLSGVAGDLSPWICSVRQYHIHGIQYYMVRLYVSNILVVMSLGK